MVRRFPAAAAVAMLIVVAGCGSPAARFVRNDVYAHKAEKEEGVRLRGPQLAEVDEILTALFGTPDAPAVPALDGTDTAVVRDLAKLQMAAGPVGSDELGGPRGLYREHCAHCHGITGDGNGPTAAFLNPYPRDYRPGKFKFKSTPIGYKPTHDDLKKIVLDGIPGTAMPSFKLLTDLEVEALVHYVKYLSIRGELERFILKKSAADPSSENNPDFRLLSLTPDKATDEEKANLDDIKSQAATYFARWVEAPAAVAKVDRRPDMTDQELAESRKRGRDLFYGAIANCIKCHGESALGDGVTNDYDDWAKDYIGDGKNLALVREYVSIGLPQPRHIIPRNLRHGVYRGGMRPIDLYWRVRNGIEGVPMPASTMKPEGDPSAKGLTTADIWDIVNYVQSLPLEAISDPYTEAAVALDRERLQ